MTGSLQHPPETAETPLYGDADIVAASGLALPSLRVLQSAGAIQAEKEAKQHGGFRRMWREETVLKAAIGALMNEHFAWNIRTVADVLANTHRSVWEASIMMASATAAEMRPDQKMMQTSNQDWFLELVDRQFLFIRVPALMTTILPDVIFGQTTLFLGIIDPTNRFRMIPWFLGNKVGKAKAQKIYGKDGAETVQRLYDFAMAVHANCLSKTSLNIGLQARAAWRRLRGFETKFIEAFLRKKEEEKKNERKPASSRSPAAARKGGRTGNDR